MTLSQLDCLVLEKPDLLLEGKSPSGCDYVYCMSCASLSFKCKNEEVVRECAVCVKGRVDLADP